MVYFKRVKSEVNDNAFEEEPEVDVFDGKPILCKWVNAHGTEVWNAMQLKLREPATITVRFSPLLLDETLIVYRGINPKPYEVISIDNVEERNEWLEIKVQRRIPAR